MGYSIKILQVKLPTIPAKPLIQDRPLTENIPMQPLANIRIVLIDTTHPGNIGSTARAMKVMGLSRLVLVRPHHFPDAKASAMASSAADLLSTAKVVGDLDEALADCQLVLGASARSRTLEWPTLSSRDAGAHIAQAMLEQQTVQEVAILFGTESVGLSNEQLQRCHYRIEIPANPEYSSLNLSQAVQVVCYELRQALVATPLTSDLKSTDPSHELADDRSVESFLQRLQQMIAELDILNPAQPAMLMQRLRRLFLRTRLEASEVSILQGVVSAVLAQRRVISGAKSESDNNCDN